MLNDVWEVTDSVAAEDDAKDHLGESGDSWKHNPFNVVIEGGTEWYRVTDYNDFKNAVVKGIEKYKVDESEVESDDNVSKKALLQAIAQLYSLMT